MIYLHKILPLLASPLFFSIVLIFLYIFFRKKILLFLSLCIILIFSNPIISNLLSLHVEKPYVPIKIEDVKTSDYIVVLSGDKSRFLMGVKLFKLGKAKKIIFTGGKVPWDNNELNEGQLYKKMSKNYELKSENILVTNNVENTLQESVAVSKLISKGSSIILITSAFHMSRAVFLFKRFGFKINPFPIKFFNNNKKLTFMDFIPSSRALFRSSNVIRELQGRIYYYFVDYFI